MRILILTPQLPYPPMQGTTLRNFYLLRELARRHELCLLSFMQPGDELRADSPLHDICAEIRTIAAPARRSLARRALTSLSTVLPDMALRLHSEAMSCAVREWISSQRFDVVQIEGIEMAGCGLALKQQGATPRVVFDDHNAEYALQRSAFQSDARHVTRWHGALYSYVQWQKLAGYERRVIRTHDAVAAVSEANASALRALAPEIPIFVVPNGVDTQEYAPRDGVGGAGVELVFTGKMDYRPNVDAALWFADEILPRVRAQAPEARFVVVGQSPHVRLRSLDGRPDVVLTGRVVDVKPYIERACVYVAPLRMGGGTRLKVLQAMAMGKAIVSTSLGCDGIDAQSGRAVWLANAPQEFADAVVRLMHDDTLRRDFGAEARALAVARYDWSQIAPLMEDLYKLPVAASR